MLVPLASIHIQDLRMGDAGDEDKYKTMWGARVLIPFDVPDNLLKYAITSVRDKLEEIGEVRSFTMFFSIFSFSGISTANHDPISPCEG